MKVFRRILSIPFTALLGMAVILIYVICATCAQWIAPFGQADVIGSQYDPWSTTNILGTDNIGRDLLSRLIYGAQNTIGIALLITILAFAVGGALGLVAAARGGWIDTILSWVVDIAMAIPQLIYALLLLTIFGTAIPVLVLVIALLNATLVFRLVRSVSQNVVIEYRT